MRGAGPFAVVVVLSSVGACADRTDVRRDRAEALDRARAGRAEARRELAAHDGEIAVPTTLTLSEAVRIATLHNRDYESQREQIYLDGLSLGLTRHLFRDPIFSGQLAYTFAGTRHGPYSNTGSTRIGTNWLLPTGATVTATGDASVSQASSGQTNPTVTLSGTTSITQPLLRGVAPYAFEPLTQAERDFVYEVKDFELFRQSFAIDVLARYYQLVSQKQRVENARRSVEALEFVARRAKAFFEVDRTSKIDMLRAEQAHLRARNGLIDEEQSFKLARDRFKVFLGIPTSSVFEIPDDAAPEFIPVDLDLDTAVHTALERRLDLQNVQMRLEDANRKVGVARNALLPGLNATGTYTIASDPSPGSNRFHLGFRDDSYEAGLVLDLPLERTAERRNYRASIVQVDRARRALEQAEDSVIVEVRDSLRRLRQQTEQINIQRAIIETENARVKYSAIRYQAGEIDSRDLTEARQSLLDAENSLIQNIVAYEIQRLTLLRQIGRLVVTDEGAIGE